MRQIFALFLVLYSAGVSGYGSAKEGRCPPLPSQVNCRKTEKSLPCYQDLECAGTQKCCADGCDGYKCQAAIGLPVLPVIKPCSFDVSIVSLDDTECKDENVIFCSKNAGCKECCSHTSSCSPLPGSYITKQECKKHLCEGKKCVGQGEICIMDKYHRAKCACPKGCPKDIVVEPVCGTDKVTYTNECEMNLTACVLGDLISVVHKGRCGSKDDPCAAVRCGYYSKCRAINGNAICVCDKFCTRELDPKCGSDGVTYSNPCELRKASCEQQKLIRMVSDGQCTAPTTVSSAVCSLPKAKGNGENLELRYYFNKDKGICEGFMYHGKNGNKNNFKKYKDCHNLCFKSVNNVCVMPQIVGPCRAAMPRWSYNTKTQQCEYFTYGGCHGNGNNFLQKSKCEEKCVKKVDICSLPPQPGICLAYFRSWYYDSALKACKTFIYGGCQGNANRFGSKDECNKVCGVDNTNIDLVTPRCKSPNKFICGSIKKCIPASKRCDGKDDCGDNSDETNCDVAENPCNDVVCDFHAKCIAVTKERAICECPRICTADFRPVCGSNGKTYPNLCAMEVESCDKKKTITKISDGECGPPPPTLKPFDICDISLCDFGKCVNVDGTATCQCPSLCPFIENPVCGSDEKTYSNLCEMEVESCMKRQHVDVQYDGPCKVSLPPTLKPFDICGISLCDFGNCVNVNGTATCQCPIACPFIEQPVCGSDNKTYSNLCVMDAEACEKKQYINVQHDGPCEVSKQKSKCQQEHDAADDLGLIGVFIPQCEEDGSYSKAQCHGSTGYCWCVDELGNKLVETEIRFKKPNCDKVSLPPTLKPFDICDISLCDFGKCVNVNGTATCQCPIACPLLFKPVCGSDSKTYPNLCVMDVEACEKKQYINVQHDGPCEGPKFKCEKELDALPSRPPPGTFIPKCEEDGRYSKAQCHGSTGYCWCVDELGNKLVEIEVRFKKPNCDKVSLPPTLKPFDICDISLCDFGKCVNVNGTATCQCPIVCPLLFKPVCGSDSKTYSNLCVMDAEACEKKQYINVQHDGPCEASRPKSKCEKELDALPSRPPPGTFIPKCEEDGRYSKAQCHGSTGYCWCVDELGNKLVETQIRFKKPNCDKDSKQKSKCKQEHDAVNLRLIGAFTPQCEEDGSYSKAQCHGSTGYCWCVDELGNKLVETEVRFKKPNCDKASRPKSKCEKELDALPSLPPPGTFIPKCEEDGRYSKAQCHGSTGYCWCVDELGNKLVETEVRSKKPKCTQVQVPIKAQVTIDPCAGVQCDFYSKCKVVDTTATACICDKICTREFDPQCGSNGVTYSNPCELRTASCEQMKEISVANAGKCTREIESCKKCPSSGKTDVVKSFCKREFVITGKVVDIQREASQRKAVVTVNITKRYKPRKGSIKVDLKKKHLVKIIIVSKKKDCLCKNLELKTNESYILMGRISKKNKLIINPKKGYVEKADADTVKELKKGYKGRAKDWSFCRKL